MAELQVDLLSHKSLSAWSPSIGDMIFKDGGLFRWCALVNGINSDNVSVMKSGNPTLLIMGESKEEVINVRKIKSVKIGSYFIVDRNGIYYV